MKMPIVNGGEIEIGNDGKPNGIFNENAVPVIQSAIPVQRAYIEKENEFIKSANYALSVE